MNKLEGTNKNNTKWYPGTNDLMFKAIFTNKNNNDILKIFIERALDKKISMVKVLQNELAKNNIYEKGKIVNVLAEDLEGNVYNIELNCYPYKYLHIRNFGYIASKYGEEVKAGNDYNNVSNFIQINLTKGLGNARTLEVFTFTNKHLDKRFIDNLTIYEFNLDKIYSQWYNGDKKFDFIAILSFEKEDLEKVRGDYYMEKVKGELERLNKDTRFTEFLSAEEDDRKITNTLKNIYKMEGEKHGIEVGVKKEKMDIAKNMINMNLDDETISKATGLLKEEIDKIRTSLS